jgi:hypothetical protein
VHVDWQVRVRRRSLRTLLWLLRPLYATNHRHVLAAGLDCLNRELAARRADQTASASCLDQAGLIDGAAR